MDMNKLLALGILITANNNGATPDLLHAAMDTIQNHFDDCGIKDSKDFLGHLTPDLLEEIVSNEAILADEVDLFNVLTSWVDCNCDTRSDEAAGNSFYTREKRKEVASELIEKHICLEKIIPSLLRDIVEPSGIVSCEKVLEAYKTHSFSFESGIAPPCKRTKRECWESSHQRDFTGAKNHRGTELLQCRPMASGIHSWSIEVVNMGSHRCWPGVALATDPPDRNSWLGKQTSGWVFGSNGRAYHAHPQHPTNKTDLVYGEGSVFKFRLDLTQQGTLSASVDGDGREEVLLFDNMLMIGEEKVNRSFVPAVSVKAPVSVRFLGFHRSSFHG
jgi:hypothetical protein